MYQTNHQQDITLNDINNINTLPLNNPILIAKKLREKFAPNGKYISSQHLLKKIIKNCNIIIAPYEIKADVNAISFKYENIHIIGVNHVLTTKEHNFIIAHELGHIFLNHRKTLSLNLKKEHCVSNKKFSAMDTQANAFAMELLLPAQMVTKKFLYLRNSDISEFFNVCPDVVKYRLKELNLASQDNQ